MFPFSIEFLSFSGLKSVAVVQLRHTENPASEYEINVFEDEKRGAKHYFDHGSSSDDPGVEDDDYVLPIDKSPRKKRGRKPKSDPPSLKQPRTELDLSVITENQTAILQKQFDFCPYLVVTGKWTFESTVGTPISTQINKYRQIFQAKNTKITHEFI